ncbi:MBL fold metallo-hydrolase [Aestuariirhabdus sp. Z084]|uniref:MBL fold metallo-hydrolase n=1 Tax=Aestuariirhabdus haliotis TaxID=2918751 RepID=UPI00201B3A50|nr:MBL fold metallo-hydrolase [Aestuariirhabdus haliotis]MCL6417467.1 MBL fold metallo-hydrolase [Aestuariirhabdus haliotis]MCL6421414.1 MBL fold metallo-hydrolase [Aestuariirhabdus haliotis]
MKIGRIIVGGVLLIAVLAVGGYGYIVNVYLPPPIDEQWLIASPTSHNNNAVTVRFSGTSTLLFDDGDTAWMVDGWFSRPGALRLLFGTIAPDLEAIEYGLQANQVSTLAAVFPVHSHYDHAMDSPEVAKRTGAVLLGSEATANIGRGWNVPETQIRVVENRQPIKLGNIIVTPIESRHFDFRDPQVRKRLLERPDIDKPLVPPVKAFDYRLGKVYVLHVTHPRGSWLIVGSAGSKPGSLAGIKADTVFLGVGGIGSQSAAYREAFWKETVGQVTPQRVIPIHYDSLLAPITDPIRGPSVAENLFAGGLEETRHFLQKKAADHPAIEFKVLPKFDKVVLYP